MDALTSEQQHDEDVDASLRASIDHLQNKVARLESENAALRAQLAPASTHCQCLRPRASLGNTCMTCDKPLKGFE